MNEFRPRIVDFLSGGRNGGSDGVVELLKDVLPDCRDLRLHFFFNILAALGTLVASFEELALNLLGLSESCLVDLLSVLDDEGGGSRIVPTLNLILNGVEVCEGERLSGKGLAHVAISLSGRVHFVVSHLDGGGGADKGGGDKLEGSHIYFIFNTD